MPELNEGWNEKIKELNDIPKFWTYYDMKLRNYRASTQFDVEVLANQRNLSFEDSFPSWTQSDWVEQSHFFGTETSETSETSADQTHEIHLNPAAPSGPRCTNHLTLGQFDPRPGASHWRTEFLLKVFDIYKICQNMIYFTAFYL